MKKRKLLLIAFPVLLSFMVFVACKKTNEGTSQLNIRMTDAPFDAQEVNVDIREVRVKFEKDSSSWVSLNTNARIYNLLRLQNGVDTLLATGTVPTGVVKEVRLILGSGNTIKIKDVVYPLSVASADEAGLKIKVSKKLGVTLETILIDFDAELSIIQTGNGTYKLKPVIKLK